MLALFCLRLACGLATAAVLLPTGGVQPRFLRVHFLTILALAIAAIVFAWSSIDALAGTALCLTVGLSFFGSFIWSVAPAPGKNVIAATVLSLVCSLLALRLNGGLEGRPLVSGASQARVGQSILLVDDLSSAALLGLATTAMLVGHSYLVLPTMSIKPLTRLLLAFFVCLFIRCLVSGIGIGFWSRDHSLGKLNEVSVLLPLRWGIGFVLPAILGTMAWQTAKMRSTQSATGILYVIVIFCFIGELISQVLLGMTGYIL